MPRRNEPPDLEVTHELRERGPVTLLLRRDWLTALPVEGLLAGEPLSAWGRPVQHDLHGRGAVHVLSTARGDIVAKAYQRGGVVGGVLRASYLDRWRPAREAAVAEGLLRRGCPTPPVVVARATRGRGGLYRLEIATARVAGARDLLVVLREAAQQRAPGRRGAHSEADPLVGLAVRLGSTLRRLHDVGLAHRDLQVKNLLVPRDDGPLPVIDLDRCALVEHLGPPQRIVSLSRFARSLVKHGLLPGLSGRGDRRSVAAIAAFVAAYGALDELARGPLRRRLRRHLRRSLRWHELLW